MTTRRDFIKTVPAPGAAFSVAGHLVLDDSAAQAQPAAPLKGHFYPQGKALSEHTLRILEDARKTLPFCDTQEFDEQKKGLIADMKDMKIMADNGHVAWYMGRFEFLNEDKDWDSIHPSLLRQSHLNQNYGLYEVVPGIY
ncbi:MAG: hypothetical protein ABJQ71_15770 [Roseibium sp.]